MAFQFLIEFTNDLNCPLVILSYILKCHGDDQEQLYILLAGDPETELVRHFLIESSPKGVRLKGCSNEPTFGI